MKFATLKFIGTFNYSWQVKILVLPRGDFSIMGIFVGGQPSKDDNYKISQGVMVGGRKHSVGRRLSVIDNLC